MSMLKFLHREPGLYRAMTNIEAEKGGQTVSTLVAVNVVRLIGGPHRWSYEIVAAEGAEFGQPLISRWDNDAVTFRQAKELANEAVQGGLTWCPDLGWCLRDPEAAKAPERPTDQQLLMAAHALERAAASSPADTSEALQRVALWLERQVTLSSLVSP